MAKLKESPSQTAGPYVHIGCLPVSAGLEPRGMGPELGGQMITGAPDGVPITLELSVLDGANDPVKDALIEIWQAGPEGGFGVTPGFQNWGRQGADLTTGIARFETLKPGGASPHILVWIAARGINLALCTRIYFPDEDNSADPAFRLAGDRADTLLAEKTANGYVHVIRLQGDGETVFFDI